VKIAFLSRYQNRFERGAEGFVKELSNQLSKKHEVNVLIGEEADSLTKVLKGDYDIVIPINGRIQSVKFSLGRILGKYKLLISGHSGKGWDDILNIALAKPDVFVALTDSMLQWARRWALGSKVVKISNGVDTDKFTPFGEKLNFDLPRPIILSVGALVWYKYHELVIKAVSQLSFGSVLVVGEGSEQQKLTELGKKLLGERFQIKNFPYEQMTKVYRSVELFTLPSWDREAFGIVYLEALASGLGVVAPDDPQRHEIIGKAGVFVDVFDSSKYAEAIRWCLETDWKKKAREQALKFSWEKQAKQYETVMSDMIKK